MKRIVIGARGSELALAQTRWVMERLQPHIDVPLEIRIIPTAGDQDDASPLNAASAPGLFTRAIESELLAGRIDAAVHSLKDLPLESPSGLKLAAIPVRARPGDLLAVSPYVFDMYSRPLPLLELSQVGTSSPRRQAQLRAKGGDIRIVPLRGNLPTRLNKVQSRAVDAAVIAEAGYERLGKPYPSLVYYHLDPSVFVPAPGQGALAVQTREDDRWAEAYRSILHHHLTAACVEAERSLLARFDGGCALPMGALVQPAGEGFDLFGFFQAADRPRRGQVHSVDLEAGIAQLYQILTFN